MTQLDVAAVAVVGTAPSLRHMDSVSSAIGSMVSSHTASADGDPNDTSTAHLKLARVRAQSAPTTNDQDSLDPCISSNFPRADSLLRLDSKTTSKDLKKLLTTRVRHAPPSIDTNRANTIGISSSSSSPIKSDSQSSQLEPEKSRPRVEVYVVLNNHVAVEGGCFSGTLTVRTHKPRRGEARHVQIDGGKVRIIGFEGVSETERYAFYQCSTPLSQASEDCAQLYESDSNNDEFRIAREGTFSLPFTIHIPLGDPSRPRKNAPKGVIQDNSVNAAIKYILLISFKVRDDADNNSRIDKHAKLASVSIAHFYRNVELWPTYGPMALHSAEEHPALGQTGTVSSRTAQGLLFGGVGMLHLTAVLHRKVWLAGQKCTVYIGAWNETKKSIKTVTLAIIRKATIARPNQSTSSNRKQIAEVTLDAVRGPTFGPVTGKGWWAGIEPGATCELSHPIDIPADSLTVHRTHIIEISYTLRVTLVTGSLSSNVSVDLPFRIINAISTDGLPTPPPPGLLIGGLKLPKEVPVSFTFDASPKHATLDLQRWSSRSEESTKTSGLQEQEASAWTKHTSDGLVEVGSGSPGSRGEPSRFGLTSQVAQEANTSYRLFDGIAPGDSMSRLMSELEYDLNAEGHPPSHYSSQRSSVAGSGILKPVSSTKHRVTFLTPKTANAHTMEEGAAMRRDAKQPVLENQDPSRYPKEPSSRRFALEDSGPVRVQPGQLVHQATDTWNDDDADEVLRSIRMHDGGFGSYRSSQGQELALNGRISGPVTGSSISSDPWSASGSSYSQPSASYQGSGFDTSPEQYVGPHPHSYPTKSISKSQVDLASKDETPRAGSVARFRPEIVTAPIRTSSSRATMVPTISSPMLAKSQSAHVIGSPVNQYRRFSPQLVASAQLGEDCVKATADVHVVSEGARATSGQSAIRAVTGERNAVVTSDSVRHSVLLPPSGSALTVVPDTKAHLRSRSGPEPSGDGASNTSAAISDTPTKSTVRSRIAALEERSRSRPISQYSNASSVNSIFLYK
ncbi:hypothetical protein FRC10_009675 [Ceratobasidium sp. 414]|nr:hypothetical protein FRC10_009675 [Ceratobasidium sp. 414]